MGRWRGKGVYVEEARIMDTVGRSIPAQEVSIIDTI